MPASPITLVTLRLQASLLRLRRFLEPDSNRTPNGRSRRLLDHEPNNTT